MQKTYVVRTPNVFFAEFEERELLGSMYNIPKNVEEYLNFKYTDNWRIPRSDWEWQKEDGSVK